MIQLLQKEFQHYKSINDDNIGMEINIGVAKINLTCEDNLVHWAVARAMI